MGIFIFYNGFKTIKTYIKARYLEIFLNYHHYNNNNGRIKINVQRDKLLFIICLPVDCTLQLAFNIECDVHSDNYMAPN